MGMPVCSRSRLKIYTSHCTIETVTSLGRLHEALHISEQERQIVLDCFSKISFELRHGVDKHTKKLISANIELFLDYCTRFYDRQVITRDIAHKGIIERFESLLNDYFQSGKSQTLGLPNVAYCAEKLSLSANYFGDLVKKETGKQRWNIFN